MACRACIVGRLCLWNYWRAFIRGIGAWKETFLLTIASVCSARLNGPWCIRATCQAVINANRMKSLIKRDKRRHEHCRQMKTRVRKMEALAVGPGLLYVEYVCENEGEKSSQWALRNSHSVPVKVISSVQDPRRNRADSHAAQKQHILDANVQVMDDIYPYKRTRCLWICER